MIPSQAPHETLGRVTLTHQSSSVTNVPISATHLGVIRNINVIEAGLSDARNTLKHANLEPQNYRLIILRNSSKFLIFLPGAFHFELKHR